MIHTNNLKRFYKKKVINLIIFILTSVIFEIIFFAYSFGSLLPLLFFLDLFMLLFLGSIIFIFKKFLFDKIYIPTILFLVCACFFLNTIFYKVTNTIFILENLKNLSSIFQRAESRKESFSIFILLPFLMVYIVSISCFLLFNFKYKVNIDWGKNAHKKKIKILAAVSLTASLSIYVLSLSATTIVERKAGNSTIDNVSFSSAYNTKKIGLLSYYVKNLGQVLFPKEFDMSDLMNYFTNSCFLNDYYTGKLKGYNVVVITIETGGEYILNQYTTPNLYKLLNEGIHCVENYSKNHTVRSELLSILGNHPSFDLDSYYNVDYELPFTLPNSLNEYETLYCNDLGGNNDVFNERPLIPHLGFDKTVYHEALLPGKEPSNFKLFNWPRDSKVMESVINELGKASEPFYMHHTTICMHYNYEDSPERDASMMNEIKAEFDQKLKELEDSGKWKNPIEGKDETNYRNYTLCSMDTDKAIGMLVDHLKERRLLDKTLLVLYGDHDCCGDYADKHMPPMSWQISGKDNGLEIDNYPTILGFYNPTLSDLYYQKEGTYEFNDFSSPMVIVPTILDLLGIKYNPKFYQGKSIFDPSYGNEIFYSMFIHAFMNKNYLSKVGQDIDKRFTDVIDTDAEKIFLKKCAEFLEQVKYFDFIYKNNIFKHCDYNLLMPKN